MTVVLRNPRISLAAVCTVLSACMVTSCGHERPASVVVPAPASGANLVLVTVDTLRADHLPAYGYGMVEAPAISRLASEGLRFAAAFTPAPLTLPSHSSLFTGLLPVNHGVRDNGGFHLDVRHATLAETLKKEGYATAAFVSAFVLDSRWGLARGFDTYFDEFTVSAADLGAMARVQRPAADTWVQARTWLDGHLSDRFFAWIHLFDPHTPYAPPEPFRTTYADRPYDGEIAYVDSVIAQITRYLESRSLLENTLVVLVADHGEGLGEHDEDEHGLLAYDSTLHVPWIMRIPNRQFAGRVIEEPVSLVDVFPTIAVLMGTSAPSTIDGVDRSGLIDAGGGNTDVLYAETFYPRLRMGWSELTAIRSGQYKYIRAPVPELYTYREDPGETNNLASRHPEVVSRLDRILNSVLAERASPGASSNAPDPQTVKQLQALGYVSGAPATLVPGHELSDPKSKTGVYRSFTLALQWLSEGREAAGVRALQQVILDEPGLEVARRRLRDYWVAKRQFSDARTWLRSALRRHPREAGLWRDLAIVSRVAGEAADARAAIDRALSLAPDDADSLVVSGEVHRDARHLDAALASFRRASVVGQAPVAARMQAGQTLIAIGNLAEAETLVRSVLAADANAANAHYLLAQIAELRNDSRTAEQEYRQEIERNPWEYRARFNLALLIGARGDGVEKLALLQSIPSYAPDFGEVYFHIAKALLDTGDRGRLEEAARAAERGLQIAPAAPSAPLGHYVLADVYQLTNRPSDARREVDRARELEKRLAAQPR